MTDYEPGETVALNKKHSAFMASLDVMLRHTLAEHMMHFEEDLTDIPGGPENAVMAAAVKFSAGIAIISMIASPEEADNIRKLFLKFVDEEIQQQYDHKVKENLKSSR